MAQYNISVNGEQHQVDAPPDTPMLWLLRDRLGLTGTKYGCGIAACGACAILLDGAEERSCQLPISEVGSKKIVTIEGLTRDGSHPAQRAWMENDVPQCGYCQPGQVIATAALLNKSPKPTDAEIDQVFETHICRCGTYHRIREAVKQAAKETS